LILTGVARCFGGRTNLTIAMGPAVPEGAFCFWRTYGIAGAMP
jgi:hypothetical protein